MIGRLSAAAPIATLLLVSCMPKIPVQQTARTSNVDIWTVETTDFRESVSLPAVIEPSLSIKISAEIGGTVKEVRVHEGDEIEEAGIILQFDDSDLVLMEKQAQAHVKTLESQIADVRKGAREQQVAEAKAALDAAVAGKELAQTVADRRKALVAEKVLPAEALDQALSQLTQAKAQADRAAEMLDLVKAGARDETIAALEAQLDGARAALSLASSKVSKSVVRSPITGFVHKRNIDPEEFAGPGVALFEIIAKTPVRAVVAVPERVFTQTHESDGVTVSVKSLGVSFPAWITRRAFAAESRTQTFDVTVELPNPVEIPSNGVPGPAKTLLLNPGLIAQIEFKLTMHSGAVAVPADAVVLEGSALMVYVVDGGKAKARPVEVGMKTDGLIEIVSGLDAGDKLVVEGQRLLRDGDPVRIVNERSGPVRLVSAGE